MGNAYGSMPIHRHAAQAALAEVGSTAAHGGGGGGSCGPPRRAWRASSSGS